MDKTAAIAAARRAGAADPETLVATATIMGTAVAENNGTLVVHAAGDYAVETLDQTPAVTL